MRMLDRSRLPRIFLEGLGTGITRSWLCPGVENDDGGSARDARKFEAHHTPTMAAPVAMCSLIKQVYNYHVTKASSVTIRTGSQSSEE